MRLPGFRRAQPGWGRAGRRRILLMSLALAWSRGPALALGPGAPLDQIVVQEWGLEQGLPQSTVQSIVQDGRGYLWLATQEGVARFDGVRFVVTDTRSASPLPAANVLALLVDGEDLWIGTRGGGLSCLRGDGTVQSWRRESGLAGLQVRSLLRDGDGLWAGTRGGGLQRFDPASGRFAPPVEGVPSRLVLDLARGLDGSLWIATEGAGVCRFLDGEVACYGPDRGFPSLLVRTVAVTPDGRVWAGTYGDGLAVLEGGSWRRIGAAEGLRSGRVTALSVDRMGTLWIGTAGGGVQRLVGGLLEGPPPDSPLASGTVYSMLTDREGNLWVGTEARGLCCVRESVFGNIGTDSGLPSSMVRTVMEGRDGSIWIGMGGGGLARLRGREVRVFDRNTGLPSEDVFSLYEDPLGRVWVGTYGGGLARLERGRFRRWGPEEGFHNLTVWAIAGDGGNGVWAGTFGDGLYHVTDRVVGHLGAADGLPSDLVRCLLRSRTGELWVGTANGLARVEGRRAWVPEGLEELGGVTVFDILETDDGDLWLATNGSGVFRWNGKRLARLGLEEGLFDEVVFRFLEDRTGDLWMTSNRGVARVSMVDLTAVAEGRKDRLSMEVYGPSDGLATPECNGGSQPAGWVAASGKVWLPTPRGLAVVQPERAALPVPTPVMVLEGFTADGRVRDPRQAVVLPAGTREVSISFTALSFISPSRLRFRYRLEGLSDAWKDGGQAREVAYSRLPPGRYRFQVQARNRRSGWADPPAAVTFTVRAFLWQMPVFWAVSAVALVLLGFALAQGTAARLRRRADELRRLVEDRTRDLLHTTLDLEDANARLEELSQRDPLTGLANRRFMDERATALLEEAAREGDEVSLLVVDVDRFKSFNDLYGHQEGDRCLQGMAALMADRFGRPADLVARWGGEEFVLLLSGAGRALGQVLAEELRRLVEAEAIPHAGSSTGVVTVSIGVATMVPRGAGDLDALLRRADRALYRAKEAGRNRVEVAESDNGEGLS